MDSRFRKLNIDLPRQPTKNQLPWLIAGILMAFIFLVTVVYAFLKDKGILI